MCEQLRQIRASSVFLVLFFKKVHILSMESPSRIYRKSHKRVDCEDSLAILCYWSLSYQEIFCCLESLIIIGSVFSCNLVLWAIVAKEVLPSCYLSYHAVVSMINHHTFYCRKRILTKSWIRRLKNTEKTTALHFLSKLQSVILKYCKSL